MPRRAEAVHAYIATHPGVTDDELVAALSLPSRAAVAAVCRRLEEAGRIERRKEGRIVRNFVAAEAPEPAEAPLVPASEAAVARGTDVGLLAMSPVLALPGFLRRPAALLVRVDVEPRREIPGGFAGACLSFDGARLSLHLRAAVPDVTSTPVAQFARAVRAAGRRAAVTVRLLPRLPDEGVFPRPPADAGEEPLRSWRTTVE